MKAKDLEFLEGYLEKLKNQTQLISLTQKTPNAPVDATRGLEAELQRCRDENRDKLLDILVQETVERLRKEDDDGR